MPSLRGMTERVGYVFLALTVAAEICLVGWWVAGGDSALAAPLQLLVLVLLGLSLLTVRYGQLKREHLSQIRSYAAAAERTRLAEDMHDLLGHELTLIALEAGRLQVTRPEAAVDAARIREHAGAAVLRLREIVGILGAEGPPGHPAIETVADVIESSSSAGMSVSADLGPLGDVMRPVALTITGLVREGLTNAARHAPGEPVSVHVERLDDVITVEVTNPTTSTTLGAGTGLASWERRVRLLSGTLDTGIDDGVFRVRAALPAHTQLSQEPVAVRPPVLTLVRDAVLPVVATLVVLTAFWSWSSHDAELSADDFARVKPGQSEDVARRILPDHQARIRLNSEPPVPPGETCRTYSDGNFPLAQSTYRICFADGVVVTTEDLRR